MKKPGTSIIEIVIAAALISMSIVAALSLTNRSQKQNTYAKTAEEASKYAYQAADWLRNERNNLGWATLANKSTTDGDSSLYCLNSLPSNGLDYESLVKGSCDDLSYIAGTTLKRELVVDTSSIASGILKYRITVSWLEQDIRTNTLEVELSSWR